MDISTDTVTGPIHRPTNITYQDRGSIHDDETARQLGLRGGTIAASTHFDQFPPVLVEAFGREWFESGSLSLYFRHATTDGEPVQAFVDRPSPGTTAAQTIAMMRTDGGTVVAEGTASIGDHGEPTVARSPRSPPRTDRTAHPGWRPPGRPDRTRGRSHRW